MTLMPAVALVVPGPISTRTGGSIYNRRMAEGLVARGWRVDVIELPGAFPFPNDEAVRRAGDALDALPDDALVLVDGLALNALPDVAERTGRRCRLVALVHLPLIADKSRSPLDIAALEPGERRALLAATRVIVTGAACIPLLARYRLPAGSIVIVEPGTDRKPIAAGSSGAEGVRLLTVGTIHAAKGYDVLLRALARQSDTAWQLRCVGSVTRDPKTTAQVQSLIDDYGLGTRVVFTGELASPGPDAEYDAADVFVTPTLQETFGMSVAEALAHGLPVIGTTTGEIPALVGADAGLVVPPGDVDALADALHRVLSDAALRARLAGAARRVRERLPTWDQAVEHMATILTQVPPRE